MTRRRSAFSVQTQPLCSMRYWHVFCISVAIAAIAAIAAIVAIRVVACTRLD